MRVLVQIPGDMSKAGHSKRNPFTLAVIEAIGTRIKEGVRYYPYQIRPTVVLELDGREFPIEAPASVWEWVLDYRSGLRVNPIHFEMDLPDELFKLNEKIIYRDIKENE